MRTATTVLLVPQQACSPQGFAGPEPAAKRRHQSGIATDGPSQRRRSINHRVEPTAVI